GGGGGGAGGGGGGGRGGGGGGGGGGGRPPTPPPSARPPRRIMRPDGHRRVPGPAPAVRRPRPEPACGRGLVRPGRVLPGGHGDPRAGRTSGRFPLRHPKGRRREPRGHPGAVPP